jgi:hypothetical protein
MRFARSPAGIGSLGPGDPAEAGVAPAPHPDLLGAALLALEALDLDGEMLAGSRAAAARATVASQPESHTACDRGLRTVAWHGVGSTNGELMIGSSTTMANSAGPAIATVKGSRSTMPPRWPLITPRPRLAAAGALPRPPWSAGILP